MKFAFCDAPYFGLAVKFYGDIHPEAAVYDTVEGHQALINRLGEEFPDGWIMCLHQQSLRHILPLCPEDVRVGAWIKPWCNFKPSVRVAYAWEPIIFRGGRQFEDRSIDTVRDWVSANMAMQKGLVGAKPAKLIRWALSILNAHPDEDEVVDLFPGSGIVTRLIEEWKRGVQPKQLEFLQQTETSDADLSTVSKRKRHRKDSLRVL